MDDTQLLFDYTFGCVKRKKHNLSILKKLMFKTLKEYLENERLRRITEIHSYENFGAFYNSKTYDELHNKLFLEYKEAGLGVGRVADKVLELFYKVIANFSPEYFEKISKLHTEGKKVGMIARELGLMQSDVVGYLSVLNKIEKEELKTTI